MEKQMMFMLKCLVERKTYRGGDRGRFCVSFSPGNRRHRTVPCLLLPSGMVRTGKKRDRNLSLKCAARTGIEPMILP